MKKRIRKKYEKMEQALKDLSKVCQEVSQITRFMEERLRDVQKMSIRLTDILKDNKALLNRFPAKVEDWATKPPKYQGRYILYFIRGNDVLSRLFELGPRGWVNGQGKVIDLAKYKPKCYFQIPELSEYAKTIYREGSDEKVDS